MSQIGNLLAAKWTAVLASSDPLLNTLCMEYVHLIAVQGCHEFISVEVTPADGALFPKTTFTCLSILNLLFLSSILGLEFSLVKR